MPHLDLDVSNLALWKLHKLELTKQSVLRGHSIVTGVHHHAHLALVAVDGGEGLLGSAWGGHGVGMSLYSWSPTMAIPREGLRGWHCPALEGILIGCGACRVARGWLARQCAEGNLRHCIVRAASALLCNPIYPILNPIVWCKDEVFQNDNRLGCLAHDWPDPHTGSTPPKPLASLLPPLARAACTGMQKSSCSDGG